MARAVLPRQSDRARWLLTGHTDLAVDVGRRAPPLDEEGSASEADEDVADDGEASLREGAAD